MNYLIFLLTGKTEPTLRWPNKRILAISILLAIGMTILTSRNAEWIFRLTHEAGGLLEKGVPFPTFVSGPFPISYESPQRKYDINQLLYFVNEYNNSVKVHVPGVITNISFFFASLFPFALTIENRKILWENVLNHIRPKEYVQGTLFFLKFALIYLVLAILVIYIFYFFSVILFISLCALFSSINANFEYALYF
jgi:hypothetical protein